MREGLDSVCARLDSLLLASGQWMSSWTEELVTWLLMYRGRECASRASKRSLYAAPLKSLGLRDASSYDSWRQVRVSVPRHTMPLGICLLSSLIWSLSSLFFKVWQCRGLGDKELDK